jgi:PAS domain S-box-containing protein
MMVTRSKIVLKVLSLIEPICSEGFLVSMQFKIVHKGLLLISIPLFFELTVFGVLVRLELDAEQSAQRAIQARAISDGVNQIEKDIHAVGKFLRGLSYQEALSADIRPYCSKILDDVANLEHITPNRPGYAELFARTRSAVREGQSEILAAREAIVNAPWSAYAIIKKARKTIDTDLGEAISPQLLDLADAFSHDKEEKLAEQARTRVRTFLFAVLPTSLFIAVLAVFWFTRNISNRLTKLCTDAELLSRGKPMAVAMEGADEIAQLDRTYHETAQQLADKTRKLQTAFDYAADLILGIDSKRLIVNANQTSTDMLGIDPKNLFQHSVVDFIAPNDIDKFLNLIADAMVDQDKSLNAEITLIRRPSKLIPTVCVPRYSPLEKSTFCVFHDITQRKEAESIRQEVFAMITHDLRAPLTSFKGFLEMAELGRIGELSESGLKLLPMAERSVSKMTQLMDDILTLEKLRGGALKPQLAAVSVDEVMQNLVEAVYFAAEKRKVRIEKHLSRQTLMTDQNRLEQILQNFLANALKYSQAGGKVLLECTRSNNEVRISVKDQGPGMTPEEVATIFHRFHHGSKVDADLPSSGLGLTICEELARFLGAHVEVESAPGAGSTFSVVFPGGN